MLNVIKKKQVWIPVVAILVLAVLVSLFRGEDDRERIDFSEVLAAARNDSVERVEVRGTRLDVTFRGEDREVRSRVGRDTDLVAALQLSGAQIGGNGGLEIEYHGASGWSWIYLVYYAVLLVAVYVVVRSAVTEGMRRARTGAVD